MDDDMTTPRRPANGEGLHQITATDGEFATLRERQRSLTDDVAALNTSVNSRFTELTASFNSRFGELASAINTIGAKFDQRSQTPWSNIIAACSVIITLGGTIIYATTAPLSEGEHRVEGRLERLADLQYTYEERARENFVPTKAFETYIATATDRRMAADKYSDDRFTRITDAVRGLRDEQVPRKEHEEKWKAQAAHDQDVQREIDEIRGSVTGIYNPRDELSRLERKTEEQDGEILQLLRSLPNGPGHER